MKIALDYRPAMVNREGIGRYTRELVRGMVFDRQSPALKLYAGTLKASAYSTRQLGIQGANVQVVRPRVPTRWMRKWLKLRKQGIDEWMGGVDLYHQSQWSPMPVSSAAEIGTIFDCIYALDAGRTDGPGFLAPDAASRMLAQAQALVDRCQRILVPTQYVANDLIDRLGADPDRIRVTPLGCDHLPHPGKPPEYLPHGIPYLITAARIDRRKNHLGALRVFERLVDLGYPHYWIVVGPMGYGYQDFVHALRHSHVRDRIKWLRMVEDRELSSLLAAADFLLWPTHNEGFGLPPLEAMVSGTPAITSNNTSVAEVCEGGAILCDPEDTDGMVEACRKLIEDSEFHRQQVEVGYEHAMRFTWRETARATWDVYRELGAEGFGSQGALKPS